MKNEKPIFNCSSSGVISKHRKRECVFSLVCMFRRITLYVTTTDYFEREGKREKKKNKTDDEKKKKKNMHSTTEDRTNE